MLLSCSLPSGPLPPSSPDSRTLVLDPPSLSLSLSLAFLSPLPLPLPLPLCVAATRSSRSRSTHLLSSGETRSLRCRRYHDIPFSLPISASKPTPSPIVAPSDHQTSTFYRFFLFASLLSYLRIFATVYASPCFSNNSRGIHDSMEIVR